MSRRAWQLLFMASVAAAGLPLVAYAGIWKSWGSAPTLPWYAVAAVAAGAVLAELITIPISRRGRVNETVAISGAFTLTLTLVAPLWVAITCSTTAVLVEAVRRRANPVAVAFNIAQYGLLVLVARGAFVLVSGQAFQVPGSLPPAALPAMVAAGVSYYAANTAVIAVMYALREKTSVYAAAAGFLRTHWASTVMELSIFPFTLLAASYSVLLLPILFLPVLVAVRDTRLAAAREEQALHDMLTGLPTLTLMNERFVEQRADSRVGEAASVAVLVVGLDRFKGINDALGWEAANRLLCAVGERLEANVRAGDLVARRGGDEFAVLAPLHEADGPAALEGLAQRLLECLQEQFVLHGNPGPGVSIRTVPVTTGATIGAAIGGQDQSCDELLADAGAALEEAKRTDRGSLRVHQGNSRRESDQQLDMLGRLRHGIDNGELHVHYQPKVDVRTGAVVGVEALTRWLHDGDLIAPYKFIPVAEQTGLIGPLTWNVLEQALGQVRQWLDLGWRLHVAVNFASPQLTDPATADRVLNMLTAHGVPASLLTIEVTETTIMSDEKKADQVLRHLRHHGVRIALDDYGTGHSSLSYLQTLSIDELKMDRSFIRHLADVTNTRDRAIVRSTISLGQDLALKVVAEGVEDGSTVEVLRELGCDTIQGFYYSPALPAGEITSWLREHKVMAAPAMPQQRNPSAATDVPTAAQQRHDEFDMGGSPTTGTTTNP